MFEVPEGRRRETFSFRKVNWYLWHLSVETRISIRPNLQDHPRWANRNTHQHGNSKSKETPGLILDSG